MACHDGVCTWRAKDSKFHTILFSANQTIKIMLYFYRTLSPIGARGIGEGPSNPSADGLVIGL